MLASVLMLCMLVACRSNTDTSSEDQRSVIFPSVEYIDADLPAGFEQSLIVSGLQSPSTMDFSPDGQLLIGERIEGKLRVLMPDGTLLPEPMVTLDIPKDEDGNPTRHNSSGIRGFVFDPDYPEEPYIYIFYMKHEPRHNRVSRFRINEDNPNRIVQGSEEVLIELPFNNIGSSGSHNGGALIFGEDDKLYITTGDGWRSHGDWGGGEPVQSLETLTGKVLRINKDGSIPTDNPFYDQTTGDYRAIYALGLRNPFSMSRHPETQQIYINDASMSDGRPEKDHILRLVEAGNYKWERSEHDQQWEESDPGIPQDPYARAGKQVITGGAWYPDGGPFPTEYYGNYFIALWGANDPNPGSLVRMISDDDTRIEPFVPEAGDGMGGMGKPVYPRVGPDGNLYWLATTYETEAGSVFKISYTQDEGAERLALPRIQPNGGRYPYPVEVHLEADSPDQQIHYTLDGSSPGLDSPRYDEPFTLTESQELKVRAFKDGQPPSEVASASFKIYKDSNPPEIAKVVNAGAPDRWQVVFDEAVERSSAEEASNYEMDRGVEIQGAELASDFKTVILTTSEPLASGIDYNLSVREVLDRAKPSNKMLQKSETVISYEHDESAAGLENRDAVRPYLNMPEAVNGDIPSRLSETGVFEDVFTLLPASGVVPFAVNTPQWNDGAVHQRWIAVPKTDDNGSEHKINFSREGNWSFPPGSVFIRHLEMTINEQTDEWKRLETQLLVADSTGSYYAVTYKWREDGRDADLVSESQSDELTVVEESGERRTQTWQFDRRSCMGCHTSQAGYVLGVNTRQLNQSYLYPETGIEDNQLRTWNAIEMFSQELEEQDIASYPQMVALRESNATLEHRVRSYLDANCSNCHRPDGVMGPELDLRYSVDLSRQGLIMGNVNNIFGIDGARAIVPGDLERSVLYQRVNATTPGIRMPPYSSRIDNEAVSVLKQWIENLQREDLGYQH